MRPPLCLTALGCLLLSACVTTGSSQPATTTGAVKSPLAVQPAAPLQVTSTQVQGRRGRTAWTLRLLEVSGPLGPEVERRVRRSADEAVGRAAEDAPEDVDSRVDVEATLTRDDGRSVQVRLDALFYAQGAARPSAAVSTVVLRRADASPVLLTDVLGDVTPALEAALRHASQVAAQEELEDPAGRLTARLEDWADWQAGPDGLTFLFDDSQAGSSARGLRSVDVPWPVVRPWVREDAYRLLGPPL